MTSHVKPIPDGYHTITPVLMVNGAAKLIDFLKQAFGAREKERFTDPTGKILHAEVTLGGSIVQLSDAMGEWKPIQVPLLLYVTDTDSTYRRALQAGATSLREPMDAFYGDRSAGVKDSFGNSWWIATHQEDTCPAKNSRGAPRLSGRSMVRSRTRDASSRSESRNTAVVFRPQGALEVDLLAGPPRGFRIRVVSSRPLTPTTHAIEVEKPEAFTFGPTQFTFLQLQTVEGMDARPMSLATSPTRPHLEYAVRLSHSPYKRAFAALQPNDEVRVFGPIGDFVLHETRPAVLLAGGIGITPLKGMAEYAADKALPIPIRLVYSNRSEDEIVYRDELDVLEQQNSRFRVLYTLTRTADKLWRGLSGRIDRELLKEAALGLADPIYYVSGTPSMVAGTLRLLRGLEIPDADIEIEAFRGYE